MKTIIIGGSATGMGVASRLKRNNPEAQIVVYQEKDYVSLGACGLPYFVSNNFDDKNMLIARTIEAFEKTGITIHNNTVVERIDFENKTIYFNQGQDSYDELVIATGAKPFIPQIEGILLENIHTITTLEDGVILKDKFNNDQNINKIAIVGAGFIGLEMTEALKELNKEVYLIEMEERVSPKVFDKEISDLIEDKLKEHDVHLMLNSKVTKIIGDSKVEKICIDDNQEIAVDAVIFAAGFKPNTDFIGDQILKLRNGAILVDQKGKTNIDHVWSAGDCASSKDFITGEDIYSPLATVAAKFARVIADNISNKEAIFSGSIRSAIVRVFDLEIARTGISEVEAKQKAIDIKTVFIKDKDHTHYLKGQSDLYLKLIVDVKNNVIIGGQMVGKNKSVLRIDAIATMIWTKAPLNSVLEQVDLVYAPPFAKTTDIIHIAISTLLK
ncbi:CoA-disulfide reductase [Spiroplasma culicicola]|uniref:NADH oxidase n=1 Tax=Spiroplasma culicicola AES-1 TaxID=1276246 RepID=W6A763_9MOLU|nr:CoA-disulfide reductase [Spiroplasma culicicola]AHI52685.1 NADH oxidase [Spiroplasma culicicola AES-1]